jgi:hypothetical protein
MVTLLLSLALAAAALAAKKAPKAGLYAGTSSEHSPVTLQVSKGGISVEHFKTVIGYDGKCGQGGGPGFTVAASTIPVKQESFSITTTFKGPVPSVPSKRGKITGKFSGTTVSGEVVIPSLKTHGCSSYKETYAATLTKG